jgi:hypothetical protein
MGYHKHDCPNCGEKTYGATHPESGATWALCQQCFDAFYVDDDEPAFDYRRRQRDERIAREKREAEDRRCQQSWQEYFVERGL